MKFVIPDTAFYKGMAQLAHKYGYPVVYAHVRRPQRGHYVIQLSMLVHRPQDSTPEAIMAGYTQKLLQNIHVQPEIWLWSHRRWKHTCK